MTENTGYGLRHKLLWQAERKHNVRLCVSGNEHISVASFVHNPCKNIRHYKISPLILFCSYLSLLLFQSLLFTSVYTQLRSMRCGSIHFFKLLMVWRASFLTVISSDITISKRGCWERPQKMLYSTKINLQNHHWHWASLSCLSLSQWPVLKLLQKSQNCLVFCFVLFI